MLFSVKDSRLKESTVGLGIISIFYWLIGIVRIVNEIFNPSGNELFASKPLDVFIYLLLQLVYIILTFYLFLMVNRRLVFNLEDDIKEKNTIENELRTSEEKFFKVFTSSPAPMLLSVLKTGKILESNEAFLKLTGYSKNELLDMTTLTLNFWVNPEDRERMVKIIEKEGRLDNFQLLGRNKSGEFLNLIQSGESIYINKEKCLISSLQDITERIKNEKIMRLRVDLWEYSTNHTVIELMTKSLDAIEAITDSKIGFFHLVNDEKKSLVLKAWSTRTKADFCKAEGEDMHYPLENAGVWADCVRTRKPVIHNDFKLVTGKKGMPEGHAEVIRELVVPVIQADKVEAVLGVGNKPSKYSELDVQLVENIAGLVWTIVWQKQASEEINKLNSQLSELAMTDDLTKIANRRAFFIKGNEEIMKARRYHLPLSVIMLDIDKFKRINDTYGHDTGDYVLQCAASLLKESVREVDIVGRVGGEEFAIVLPNTESTAAVKMAERLRNSVETHNCLKNELKKGITMSMGVAQYHLALKDLDELLRDADIALYQAKKNGRNRVELFSK